MTKKQDSTELATQDQSAVATISVSDEIGNYPALVPGSDVAEAMAANIAEGEQISTQDLTRIKTPSGGGTTWAWEDVEGEQSSKEIKGLLVHVQRRGVLWPYEEPGDLQPVLVTNDLMYADRVGEDAGDIDEEELAKFVLPESDPPGGNPWVGGQYDWNKLPRNQFGSGKGGFGKRCKESRMLFILREGEAWPVLINIGPGSLKDIKRFLMQMGGKVPHWRAVVSLTLTKEKSKSGVDFSKVVPKLAGTISKEAGQLVHDTYTSVLKQTAAGVSAKPEDFGS